MTSSGIFGYYPDIAQVIEEAFQRCGIDPSSLTSDHLDSARRSLNTVAIKWENRFPHRWKTLRINYPLADFAVNNQRVMPLETLAILSINYTDPQGLDMPLIPMSLSDWEGQNNKYLKSSRPINYYFEQRTPTSATPTLMLWPGSLTGLGSLRIEALTQIQTVTSSAENPDIARAYIPALYSSLTAELAEKYAADRYAEKRAIAESDLSDADYADTEKVPIRLSVRWNNGRRR